MGETGTTVGVSDAAGRRAAGGLAARSALNEEGATAIEYGLIVALIAVAIIGAVTSVSNTVQNDLYSTMAALITG